MRLAVRYDPREGSWGDLYLSTCCPPRAWEPVARYEAAEWTDLHFEAAEDTAAAVACNRAEVVTLDGPQVLTACSEPLYLSEPAGVLLAGLVLLAALRWRRA